MGAPDCDLSLVYNRRRGHNFAVIPTEVSGCFAGWRSGGGWFAFDCLETKVRRLMRRILVCRRYGIFGHVPATC